MMVRVRLSSICVLALALVLVARSTSAEELPALDNSCFAVVWVDLAKADGASLRQAAAACLSGDGVKTAEPVLNAWTQFHDGIAAGGATRSVLTLLGDEGVPNVSWQTITSGNSKNNGDIRKIFENFHSVYFPKPSNSDGNPRILLSGAYPAINGAPDQAQRQAFSDGAQALPAGAAVAVVIVPNAGVKSVMMDIARHGSPSFRRLVTLASTSRAIVCAVAFGADPQLGIRILAKDDAAATQIKQAALTAAGESSKLKSNDPAEQVLNRFATSLKPTQDGSAVQFAVKGSALMAADAVLVPAARVARDFYLDLEVSKHLNELATGVAAYNNNHNGAMPAHLEDVAPYMRDNPSFAEVMLNPRTGVAKGFTYVRPGPSIADVPDRTPMIFEARNGVRDANGLVYYSFPVIIRRGTPARPNPVPKTSK